MKNNWVNPNCQNSEPMKRTLSISATEVEGDGIETRLYSDIFFTFLNWPKNLVANLNLLFVIKSRAFKIFLETSVQNNIRVRSPAL